MKRMMRIVLVTILVGLLAASGYLYFQGYFGPVSSLIDECTGQTTSSSNHWPAPNESSWIAQEVAKNIADLSQFARSQTTSPLIIRALLSSDRRGIDLTWHKPGWLASWFPTKQHLSINDFLWSPALYAPFAQEQFKGLPAGNASASTGNPLETLLNPQVDVVEKENQRISAWLTKEPLNPSAHEEAALLCGLLALREEAGCFYDARPALNQLAAHLVVAQTLRNGMAPSDPGIVANLILEVMSGRARVADDLLKKWQTVVVDDPIKSAWVKALSLRNTGNWTALPAPGAEPLLVRLEYLRAASFHAGNPKAMELWKSDGTLQRMPDMARIGLSFHPSVEEGHIFSRITFPLEIAEIKRLFDAQGQVFAADKLADFVNTTPGSIAAATEGKTPELKVITPGAWGRFYQRHLLHETLAIYYFIAKSWGVPEEAAKFKLSLTSRLMAFTYFPIVQYRWTDNNASAEEIAAVQKLLENQPETLADYNAREIARTHPALGELVNGWFTPLEPPGTTYALVFRAYNPRSQEDCESYHQMNPYSSNAAHGHFRTLIQQQKPTLQSMRECFGPLLEYDTWSMKTAADALKDQPDAFEAIYVKLCEIDPDYFINLGETMVAANQPEKAAAAYQKAVDLANNRVYLANNCDWIVNYYYDHDRKEDALKIAEMAAEVYSYRGLQTMLSLQERMGNFARAEDYAQKIMERYKDSSPLIGIYSRHPELPGRAAYQEKLDAERNRLFPNGIQQVTLDSFKEPPVDGIRFAMSDRLRSLGFDRNTVIVALDGMQVHNEAQYIYVRGLSPSSKMEFIVWSKGRYQTLTVDQPTRRFGVDIINHHQK